MTEVNEETKQYLLTDADLVKEAKKRGYSILSDKEIQKKIDQLKAMKRPDEDWKIYSELKQKEDKAVLKLDRLMEEKKEIAKKFYPSPDDETRLDDISKEMYRIKNEVENIRTQMVSINHKQHALDILRDEKMAELQALDQEADQLSQMMEKFKSSGDIEAYRNTENKYFQNRAKRKEVSSRNVSIDTTPEYHLFAESIQNEIRKKMLVAMLIANELITFAYGSSLNTENVIAQMRDDYDYTFQPTRKNFMFSQVSFTHSYYSGVRNLIADNNKIRDRLAKYR